MGPWPQPLKLDHEAGAYSSRVGSPGVRASSCTRLMSAQAPSSTRRISDVASAFNWLVADVA